MMRDRVYGLSDEQIVIESGCEQVVLCSESLFVEKNRETERYDLKKMHVKRIVVAVVTNSLVNPVCVIDVQFPLQYTKLFAKRIDVMKIATELRILLYDNVSTNYLPAKR